MNWWDELPAWLQALLMREAQAVSGSSMYYTPGQAVAWPQDQALQGKLAMLHLQCRAFYRAHS